MGDAREVGGDPRDAGGDAGEPEGVVPPEPLDLGSSDAEPGGLLPVFVAVALALLIAAALGAADLYERSLPEPDPIPTYDVTQVGPGGRKQTWLGVSGVRNFVGGVTFFDRDGNPVELKGGAITVERSRSD